MQSPAQQVPPQTGGPVDDAEVIGASLTESAGFGAIFDRHAPHIQRYLARRLGRRRQGRQPAELKPGYIGSRIGNNHLSCC
jgi:hypothetical protein